MPDTPQKFSNLTVTLAPPILSVYNEAKAPNAEVEEPARDAKSTQLRRPGTLPRGWVLGAHRLGANPSAWLGNTSWVLGSSPEKWDNNNPLLKQLYLAHSMCASSVQGTPVCWGLAPSQRRAQELTGLCWELS